MRHPKLLALAAAVVLASALAGCSFMRSNVVPLQAKYHAGLGAAGAHGLVVLLPGFNDEPVHFQKNGFVDAINQLAPGWDMVAVDLHFGYYRAGIFRERLEEDIIGPAAALGYKEIWLVGISMGAVGATSYAAAHEDQVAGIILLAPYMGSKALIDEVEAAGSLAAWNPGDLESVKDPKDKLYRENWAWLRGYAAGEERPTAYIGWGKEDHLARASKLFADALPPEQVTETAGEHGWATWLPIFQEIVPKALKR